MSEPITVGYPPIEVEPTPPPVAVPEPVPAVVVPEPPKPAQNGQETANKPIPDDGI